MGIRNKRSCTKTQQNKQAQGRDCVLKNLVFVIWQTPSLSIFCNHIRENQWDIKIGPKPSSPRVVNWLAVPVAGGEVIGPTSANVAWWGKAVEPQWCPSLSGERDSLEAPSEAEKIHNLASYPFKGVEFWPLSNGASTGRLIQNHKTRKKTCSCFNTHFALCSLCHNEDYTNGRLSHLTASRGEGGQHDTPRWHEKRHNPPATE